jgi:hypothetical protein
MSENPSISQFDHFIPVATSRLIEQFEKNQLPAQHLGVMKLLKQLLAYQFYLKLEHIKKLYQPLNPDRELLLQDDVIVDAKPCIVQIRELLIAANYTELNQQQIEYALQKTSPYGLEIHIDFEAFADVSLFYRGKSNSSSQIRDWKTLYLKKKSISMIQYQRLFLLLRYKDSAKKPGLHLKLFKDILRPDLEMLFPESSIRMKGLDKIKLGITGGGGTAGGLFATIGKVSAAVSPWTIVIAVAGFAMLIWRQVSKIFIQKTRYMATLAQNLYFHNMDNNAGALTLLIDLARQEEIKEVILAYALINSQSIKNQEELDNACEQWFLDNFNTQIDFDVSDAVEKLRQFNLLSDKPGRLSCHSPEQITESLKTHWQSFI